MRAIKYISDPEAFQLIGDETRRRMIHLLRANEMTVSQIAKDLGKTPQAIYHHIRKLREAGMIEVAREERVGHFIETFYRATAEVFHLTYREGEVSKEYARREVRQALESLPKLGFEVEIDEETISKLVELQMRISSLGSESEFGEKAEGLENIDFLTKQSVGKYARRMSMTDEEFEEYVDLLRESRGLLRSMLVVPIDSKSPVPFFRSRPSA